MYRISRRIGRGGMGEVYLGLQEGVGGFERLVVVKRIDARFGDDERLIHLLLEEARLAASIQHANVVQILDISRDQDGYFLVMEYVSGETLRYVTRTLCARGEQVPPAIACRFAAEVAAGLHCAHTARDAAGGSQPIVHCDVSPPNLIVCFNGGVKIVDFGVAKVMLRGGTSGGALWGKMSYLAPEQLHDQPVDGRTDIFQLGICLHELLTGRRLFPGDDNRQRAAALLEGPIPAPSEIVPWLPASIDHAVLWALQRDPSKRPATADDFRQALEAAVAESETVSRHDLGSWMKETFAQRLAARTEFEQRCVVEMREGRSGEILPGVPLENTRAPSSPGQSVPEISSQFVLPPIGGRAGSRNEGTGATNSALLPMSSKSWMVVGFGALAVLLVTGTAIAWEIDRRSSTGTDRAALNQFAAPIEARQPAPAPVSPRWFHVAVTAAPPDAIIEVDGIEVGHGSYRVTLPTDGTRHDLAVRAEGFQTFRLDFTDEPPPARIELQPLEMAAPKRREPPAIKAPRRTTMKQRVGGPFMTDNPDPWDNPGRAR